MTDTVYIVDMETGRAVCEVACVVSRQWKLQRTQRPERAVMAIKAADFTAELMNFRNYVVVVSDVVPTWCGYVAVSPASRKWRDGTLYVTLFGAEYLLSLRRLPFSGELDGVAPVIFSALIVAAEKRENMFISNADTTGGTNREYLLEYQRQTVFDAMNEMTNNTQNYWWIEPMALGNAEFSQSSRIKLSAKMSRQRADPYVYPHPLVEGTNLVNIEAEEVGHIANSLYVQAENESGDDPIEVLSDDLTSISDYGLIEDVYKHPNATNITNLKRVGAEQLRRRAIPRKTVSADVITTPYPQIGQKVWAETQSCFFTGNYIGWAGYMIVKQVSYSPLYASVHVEIDNIFWD